MNDFLDSLVGAIDSFELLDNDDMTEYLEEENVFCKAIRDTEMPQGEKLDLLFCKAIRDTEMPQGEKLDLLRAKLDSNPGLANCSSDFDYRYLTALERAVDELNVEVVELLFERGADPSKNCYTTIPASSHSASPSR